MFRPVSPAPKAKGQKVQVPVQPEWETDADRYTHTHHSPHCRRLFLPDIQCGCLLGYSTNKQFYTGAAGAECTRKKNYFRQADRKIMQSRVEKKTSFLLRMLRKAQPP